MAHSVGDLFYGPCPFVCLLWGKSSEHLCPSFNHTLYFLLLMFKNSLSILHVSVSYMFVKSCPIWGYLFISLMVSFEEKQLVIVMKSIFLLFVWVFSFILCLRAIAKTSPANSQVMEVYSIVLRVPQPSLLICVS